MGLHKRSSRNRAAGRATLAAALACSWSLWADFRPPVPLSDVPYVNLPVEPALDTGLEFSEIEPAGPALPEAPADEAAEGVWPPALTPPPEPELEPFIWPDLPSEAHGSPFSELLEQPFLTPQFLSQVQSVSASNPVVEFVNSMLSGPELLLGTGTNLLMDWIPRPDPERWGDGDDRPVVFRVLDLHVRNQGALLPNYLHALLLREQSFFTRLAEWDMDLDAYGEGVVEIDLDYLERKQKKLVWDTLRRTYMARYQLEGRETVRKDAFGYSEWRTIDYVVIPPAGAAYLYFRGFDQRITSGDLRLNVGVEPIREWVGFKRDFVGGLTVEVMVKACPLGLVAAFGVSDGEFTMDFIGIGTEIDIALKALARRQEEPYVDRRHR